MRKTGDEYAGGAAALAGGGRSLSRLERQAAWEAPPLWMVRVLHAPRRRVVLKRTPVLVRFHPLWWIRHAAVRKAKQAAADSGGKRPKSVCEATPTPTPVAAAVAAAAAAAAAMDAAAAADESGGVADAVYAEAYLDEAARAGLSSDDTPSARFDAEVGEYSRESARLADEL